ncbi:hypothetical protein SAMN05443429_10944 [Cruoricaptor ignavus]|uniref:Uncharacterized protein n=1 Tax=Cruoricaptor ignavus TaxID=1118202 RepID=A0A1M6GKH0_9FLAO|nr:hypothetical protein [Cruoricaptor ignavus]SHJ10396.1 hypothetical protein SAMN05443429_10944 [Cruoricaptor ignavus]
MPYFHSLSESEIISIIYGTERQLLLSLPSFHQEISTAILNLRFENSDELQISLLMDFDPETFRNGYGDKDSVERLMKEGLEIKNLHNNRISFIISDDVGYYLFIESRTLIDAEKKTINAVQIDPVSVVRLKKYFFAESHLNLDIENELANAIIEESKNLEDAKELLNENTAGVMEITEEEKDFVFKDLHENPPLHPDFKRIVEYYNNQFQYVRLRFEGANIENRKITIPSSILPVNSIELKERLTTKLEIFSEGNNIDILRKIDALKLDIEKLREQLLKKVKSREESILKKTDKLKFNQKVDELRRKLEIIKFESLQEITDNINKAKIIVEDELRAFVINSGRLTNGNEVRWEVSRLLDKVRFPKADKLFEDMKISVQYSDITFEDLKNKQFLDELISAGIIEDSEQLTNFSRGIALLN